MGTNTNLSAESALPTRSLAHSLIQLSRKIFGNIAAVAVLQQASSTPPPLPASLLPTSPIAFITDDNWGDATEQTFLSASLQQRCRRDGGVRRRRGRRSLRPLHSRFAERAGSSGCRTSLAPPTYETEGIAANDAPTSRIYSLLSSSLLTSAGKSLRSLGEIKNNQGGGGGRVVN